MVAPRPWGAGLVELRVRVAAANVAFLRYVLEAHDNLGLMHSDGSGEVSLMAPESQADQLAELVRDLADEGVLEWGGEEPPRRGGRQGTPRE